MAKKKPVSNTWTSKEWKEKRKERIGDTCEMCGTKGATMHLHHTYVSRTAYRDRQKTIVVALLHQKIDAGELKAPVKYRVKFTCKTCGIFDYSFAKKPIRSFVCPICKRRVIPEVSEYQSYYIGKIGYKKFIEANKQYLDDVLASEGYQNPEYLDLGTDTRTLCQRCHFATENGMLLCHLCKKQYMRPPNTTCWRCRDAEQKRNAGS